MSHIMKLNKYKSKQHYFSFSFFLTVRPVKYLLVHRPVIKCKGSHRSAGAHPSISTPGGGPCVGPPLRCGAAVLWLCVSVIVSVVYETPHTPWGQTEARSHLSPLNNNTYFECPQLQDIFLSSPNILYIVIFNSPDCLTSSKHEIKSSYVQLGLVLIH